MTMPEVEPLTQKDKDDAERIRGLAEGIARAWVRWNVTHGLPADAPITNYYGAALTAVGYMLPDLWVQP